MTFAECVLPGHPDKLCDAIADRVVELAIAREPRAMVGVEVALHREVVFITGCVATNPPLTEAELGSCVREAFWAAGYSSERPPCPSRLRVVCDVRLDPLDADTSIMRSISDDQAVCVGWAGGRAEDRWLPFAHRAAWLAAGALRRVGTAHGLGPDGKVIVAASGAGFERMSLSIQHPPGRDRGFLFGVAREVAAAVGLHDLERVSVNAGGDFEVGGPHGDNGLSGKKLVVDAYGPTVPIGGGAWSGKDPHKVDRLGAARARELAVRAVSRGVAREALVTLGWFPGDRTPSLTHLQLDGRAAPLTALGPVDLTIDGTHRELRLGRLRFADRAARAAWFQEGLEDPGGGPDHA